MISLNNSFFSFIPVQNNLHSLQSDISQQFETLLDQVNSQKVMMAALEEKVQKVNSMIVANGQHYCRFSEVKVDFSGQ